MMAVTPLFAPAAQSALVTRPRARFDPIEVRAFETRTGRVVAKIPFVGIPRWSFGINASGSWSVSVKLGKDGIDKVLLDGITDPWRFSFAISQGSRIWQAGPVVTEDYNDGDATTTIGGGGLFKLLTDKRLLLNPARAVQWRVQDPDADVLFGPTGYVPTIGGAVPVGNRDLSLHTIFKRILQTITAAPGGNLPLVYPADIAGTAAREYPGYDMAPVGQRLAELSQVIDGPEYEFAPEFVDPQTKQAVQWRVRIGNSRLGTLTFPHYWDQDKALIGSAFAKDGAARITLDFERGNGMNRDLVVGMTGQTLTSNPSDLLLENAGSEHTSSSSTDTLTNWASAVVLNGLSDLPTMVHHVRVPGDDGSGNQTRSPNITEISSGDNGVFVIKNHPRLADGAYACRIITAENDQIEQTAVLTTHVLGKVTS